MYEHIDIFAKRSEKHLRSFLKKRNLKLQTLNLNTAKKVIFEFYSEFTLSVEIDRTDEALSFSAAHMHEKGLLAGFEYIYRPKTSTPDQSAFRLRLLGHYHSHENLYGQKGSGIYYQGFSTVDWERIKWGMEAVSSLEKSLHETGVYQFLKGKDAKFFRVSHRPFYGTYGHL